VKAVPKLQLPIWVKEGLDVKLVFDGPATKVDSVVQANMVENQITKQSDAILLAPDGCRSIGSGNRRSL
jgi:hypothetical protein